MFFGEFQYRVDEKGRLPVPPRFRHELKDGLVLTPGVEKCLNVYSLTEWKKLASALAETTVPLAREKARRLNRFVFATAFVISMDSQGRIALPPLLREYADIGDEVAIAGVNNYLEIWNKTLWEAEKVQSQEQAWQTIESLEKR